LLSGAEAPDVRLIGVQGRGELVEDSQAAEDAEEILGADAAIAVLEPDQSGPGDVAAVGKLGLGQAAQLAPSREILAELT